MVMRTNLKFGSHSSNFSLIALKRETDCFFPIQLVIQLVDRQSRVQHRAKMVDVIDKLFTLECP